MQLEKLETLSLNRVDISVREAVAIACLLPSLFMLGLVGIEFSLSDVTYILEHTSPFFLEISRFSIDEPNAFCSIYDVIVHCMTEEYYGGRGTHGLVCVTLNRVCCATYWFNLNILLHEKHYNWRRG